MARGPNADTLAAVREMLDGYYGSRYCRAIARVCELPLADARTAMEACWIALLPRIQRKYGPDPLGHLTSAIARAIYGGMPASGSPMIRYLQESLCVDRFAERVRDREEPFIEDCLKAEFAYFLSGEDPGPYRAAMAMPGA